MKLEKISTWSIAQLEEDIEKGGKFVYFTYAIYIIAVTFKRPSSIYYIKSNQWSIFNGWPYLLLSLLFGWWGFPWGPIITLESIARAFFGRDVTDEVMEQINAQADRTSIQDFNRQAVIEEQQHNSLGHEHSY